MKMLKKFFDFYLNSSMHVALSVVSLLSVTSFIMGYTHEAELLGFTFFSTIVCYNFVKYGVEAEKYIIVSNLYHRVMQVFSFVCFVPTVYFLLLLDREKWMAIIVLSLLSVLYAVPLLPNAKNLRSLGGLKIYIVALVWVGFTVFLPVLGQGDAFSWDVSILYCQRFILVLVLLLPFEIRDLKWDSQELRTLPQVLGIKKTKTLGIGLTFLWFLLTFLMKDMASYVEIGTRFIIEAVLTGIFLFGGSMQKKYLVSFWVEGIPIMWCALLWITESFI